MCKKCYKDFLTEDRTTIIPSNDLISQEHNLVKDMSESCNEEEERDNESDTTDTDNVLLVSNDDDTNSADDTIDRMVNNSAWLENDISLDLTTNE